MYSESWFPHGRALRDFFRGDRSATIVVHSDLGERDEMPVQVFFREPADFFPFERVALELCRGRILDVGAGTGVHALLLQERGLSVCAIDFVPEAVEIMRARGVQKAHVADLFDFHGGPFDTVLMLMNGAGIVETLDGLDRFLHDVPRLLAPGGQVVLDSTDVRPAGTGPWPPGEPRREDGRYIGELQFQLEYRGERAPPFAQLYVDPDTLAHFAARAGGSCEIVHRGEHGDYVARLTR